MLVKQEDIRVGGGYRFMANDKWHIGKLLSLPPFLMKDLATGEQFIVDEIHYVAVIDMTNGGGV